MKTRLWLVLGMTSLFILSSCNEDKIISNSQLVKSISVTGQDFLDGDGVTGTRSAYTVDGSGFHFSWTHGDTVGIYPVGGDQVAFPISCGEGSQTAQFDGGAWALRTSYLYAAYYPFSERNYHIDETKLPVSYIGQTQNGNGSLMGLGRFDYQVSAATKPDGDGNVFISLKHLGCFVRFQLTMPVADTYKSITLQSSKTQFVTSGTYDLSKENLSINPNTTSSSIAIGLNNTATTNENKVLTVYLMLAPSDFTDSEINILIEGEAYKSYTTTIAGKNMNAGKAYSYSAAVHSGTNINGSDVEWDDEGNEVGPQFEYVDLGLSVYWASFNVGASKPEEYGDYYAWGETETKEEYMIDWYNYKFRASGHSDDDIKFSKYNNNSTYGIVDNKMVLDLEDDAAHVKWGGDWRMPTQAEFKELYDNCIWSYTEINGVAGFLIVSKIPGYTDRKIFLPSAGYYSRANRVGTGAYWSSSLYGGRLAVHFYFYHTGQHSTTNTSRYYGMPIRPVRDSETWLSHISLSIEDSLTLAPLTGKQIKVEIKYDGNNETSTDFITDFVWESDNPDVAYVQSNGSVIAMGTGIAHIKVHYKTLSAQCVVKVVAGYHESVDLGLSVKWAACNIGSNSPEDYGEYYAWGETQLKYNYSWTTYKYCRGSIYTLTKYCGINDYGYDGFTDDKTVLDLDDDAAKINWGGNWRLPTNDEINELLNNCTWTWTKLNGIDGCQLTSKVPGYENRSIFFPASGRKIESEQKNVGYFSAIWSNSVYNLYANALAFTYSSSDGKIFYYTTSMERDEGIPIRPVCSK